MAFCASTHSIAPIIIPINWQSMIWNYFCIQFIFIVHDQVYYCYNTEYWSTMLFYLKWDLLHWKKLNITHNFADAVCSATSLFI